MLTINRPLLALFVPLLLVAFLVALVSSSVFQFHADQLSLAVTLDFAVTIPIIYLIIIWKQGIPKITVVPVFIAGIVLASLVLPKENQHSLELIKSWALPIVELGVVTFVLLKVRRLVLSFRSNHQKSDFYSTLKQATKEVLPGRISSLFAMEISMIYYSLFAWKRKELSLNEFSYHKQQSSLLLMGVFIFLIGIETFAVHIFLATWSEVAAWVLTALSIYTMLQLLAITKSLSRRPHYVDEAGVWLAYGIASEAYIPFSQISSIELSGKEMEKRPENRHLSFLNANEGHNVIVSVKNPQKMEGLYGVKKGFLRIAFHVDDKERFKEMVGSKIN